jgi:hypothetical protein
MSAYSKSLHVLDQPEIDDLLNVDQDIEHFKGNIVDSRRKPGRLAIMSDSARSIMVRRMLEAHENGEKLTYNELAKQLGVSSGVVTKSLKDVRAEWRETDIRNWDQLVDYELAVLNALEEEAFAEWHRSKLDAETVSEETNEHGEYKTKVSMKGQTGNPRYLDVIIKCIQKRAELLGLDKPKQIEVRGYEDKLIDYLKSGRVSFEEVSALIGPSMAKTFLKRANLLPVGEE